MLNKALVTQADSPFGNRLCLYLERLGWEVTPLASIADTPLKTKPHTPQPFERTILFALDAPNGKGHVATPENWQAGLAALDRSGLSRVVVLSRASVYLRSPHPLSEVDPVQVAATAQPQAARNALRLEQAVIDALPQSTDAVILRSADLLDRDDPQVLQDLRALLMDETQVDPMRVMQAMHPDDLCEALVMAARRPEVGGHIFNLADDAAISFDVLRAEVQRLGRLFSGPDEADDRMRPTYPVSQAGLVSDKARQGLEFRARCGLWQGLGECVQAVVAELRAEGRIATPGYPLSPVAAAIEGRMRPLDGKTIVVAGATSPVGYELSLLLSRCGAHVIALGYDGERGAELLDEMTTRPGLMAGIFLLADLADLDQVRRLAADILSAHDRIDALITDPRRIFPTRQTARGNIEATFATNTLAPHILTKALLPAIPPEGHVISVVSEAHRGSGVDFGDLFLCNGYDPAEAFARAQFASVGLFAGLMAKHGGQGVRFVAISPGRDPEAPAIKQQTSTELQAQGKQQRSPVRAPQILPITAAQHVATLLIDLNFATLTGAYVNQGTLAHPDQFATSPDVIGRLWQVVEALLEPA